jgi:hypothetical protein
MNLNLIANTSGVNRPPIVLYQSLPHKYWKAIESFITFKTQVKITCLVLSDLSHQS